MLEPLTEGSYDQPSAIPNNINTTVFTCRYTGFKREQRDLWRSLRYHWHAPAISNCSVITKLNVLDCGYECNILAKH